MDCATTTTGFAAHHKPDPVTTYGNATFALQPWGDTATRKGFWDALAVGAVNVVFAPRGDKVPYGMYADEFVGRHGGAGEDFGRGGRGEQFGPRGDAGEVGSVVLV